MEKQHPILVSFFVMMALVVGWILGTVIDNPWTSKPYIKGFHYENIITVINTSSSTKPPPKQTIIRYTNQNLSESQTSVSNKSAVRVYTIKSDVWTRDNEICNSLPSFRKATIRTRHMKFPIYIHEPGTDIHVSGSISRSGIWESNNVETMTTLLKKFPNTDFIDIGANLGLYSLVAAELGRRVIAVEPLKFNVQRICKSVKAGNLIRNFTIVRHALSEESRVVTMAKSRNNVGGSFIIEKNEPQNKRKAMRSSDKYMEIFQTAKLDDILRIPEFNIKDVLMKMDVEGYENKVLAGGKNFFDKINVRGILMEWMMHLKGPTNTEIIQFLTNRSFEAFHPYNADMKMKIEESSRWPTDILWLKKLPKS